jgi:hypothetical protein
VGQVLAALGEWVDKGALEKGRADCIQVGSAPRALEGDKDAADLLAMGKASEAQSSADPNAASLVKYAKMFGLLRKSFSVCKRWALILERYWLAGRAFFSTCDKFSCAVDDSRFDTSSMCGVLGAQQTSTSPFKLAWTPPQELHSERVARGAQRQGLGGERAQSQGPRPGLRPAAASPGQPGAGQPRPGQPGPREASQQASRAQASQAGPGRQPAQAGAGRSSRVHGASRAQFFPNFFAEQSRNKIPTRKIFLRIGPTLLKMSNSTTRNSESFPTRKNILRIAFYICQSLKISPGRRVQK